MKEIPFVIAGTGELAPLCKAIPNVNFVGFKTGKELNRLVGKAVCSVYPSIWYENCPLSVLESISLGTPVIGANMGGIPELIEDGKTGVIIKELTTEGLVRAVRSVWKDSKKQVAMQEYCAERRENFLSLEQYCEKLINVYKKVI